MKYNICLRSHTISVEKDRLSGGPFCVWQIHPLSDDSEDFF